MWVESFGTTSLNESDAELTTGEERYAILRETADNRTSLVGIRRNPEGEGRKTILGPDEDYDSYSEKTASRHMTVQIAGFV